MILHYLSTKMFKPFYRIAVQINENNKISVYNETPPHFISAFDNWCYSNKNKMRRNRSLECLSTVKTMQL